VRNSSWTDAWDFAVWVIKRKNITRPFSTGKNIVKGELKRKGKWAKK
jgi:hypothetical protein